MSLYYKLFTPSFTSYQIKGSYISSCFIALVVLRLSFDFRINLGEKSEFVMQVLRLEIRMRVTGVAEEISGRGGKGLH